MKRVFSLFSGIEFQLIRKHWRRQIHLHLHALCADLRPQRSRLCATCSFIARIRSCPIVPFFDPTAHRPNACAHYARRRRYARALYARLYRLPFDMLWEVRLCGVRHLFPLAVAALVHLLTACMSVLGHPIGAAVSHLTSCRYTRSRAIDRLINSNLDAIVLEKTLKSENTFPRAPFSKRWRRR